MPLAFVADSIRQGYLVHFNFRFLGDFLHSATGEDTALRHNWKSHNDCCQLNRLHVRYPNGIIHSQTYVPVLSLPPYRPTVTSRRVTNDPDGKTRDSFVSVLPLHRGVKFQSSISLKSKSFVNTFVNNIFLGIRSLSRTG